MARNQKILEDKFMGPEIITPAVRSNSVAQAQQPVIQYIAVPSHFNQQYPAHVHAQNVVQPSINRSNSI